MHLLTPETAAELSNSVHVEMNRLRANHQWYGIFFVLISVGFALMALYKLDRQITDLPHLLLVGAIHSLGYLGLYLLIWAFVVARLVYVSTCSQLEARWISRETMRRPGQSFAVAFWRFVLVAGPVAVVVFTAMAALIVAVFFVLPMQVDALSDILYAMLESD